jgi:hypothetical protein
MSHGTKSNDPSDRTVSRIGAYIGNNAANGANYRVIQKCIEENLCQEK